MKYVLIIVALCLTVIGVQKAGETFDELCIKGRISQEQADALKIIPWNHSPSYCSIDTRGRSLSGMLAANDAESNCEPRPNDRILNSTCSELLKTIF